MIASTAPVHDDTGRLVAAVGVLQDAAGIRRNDEQRRDIERFRDVFLGALGHDLRNPLTVITAGAASLSRHANTTTEAKIAARMTSSAERMARRIAQLLDLVQARLGGGLPLKRERGDLRDIAWRVIDRIEMQHPNRTIDRSAEGELAGYWDAARLAEVVHDLVLNALEHGRIDAPIKVSVRSTPAGARIDVHNSGNPIPPELMPLIFDPFRRAAERKRMKSIGLGVGLYLAAQVVRGHQGTIEVQSSAEGGTTFSVHLPREHD